MFIPARGENAVSKKPNVIHCINKIKVKSMVTSIENQPTKKALMVSIILHPSKALRKALFTQISFFIPKPGPAAPW